MLGKESYQIITGWDELGPFLEQLRANAEIDASSISFTKENAVIKVMGNTAWVICDNNWKVMRGEVLTRSESIQITFLEKPEGEWKISFAAWIPKPVPAVEETPANQ
jgi:ketosteroid isomerase-like protein